MTNQPDDKSRALLAAVEHALRPLVQALVEPYRCDTPADYALMVQRIAAGEMQLHFNFILSGKPLEAVLRMVTADAVAPIAAVTFEGGILTLTPEGATFN